jgi:tetraacyldisaccharide 4'-kinase
MINSRILPLLFLCGRIFSPFYSLIMRLRALLYARGVLLVTRVPLPVISVGNLTMGGTGKTPMVIYLARLLAGHLRPAVVSRGYGGRSHMPVNLVSDGGRVLLSAAEAGDEPVLLANSLPGVPVVTSRLRARGADAIVRQGLADLLILDDGFQHLALHRDLNLVLFSSQTSVQAEWVFPGGMLREPRSALNRADCFVLTGVGGACANSSSLRIWLQRTYPATPVYEGRYEPLALHCQGREAVAVDHLAGVPLFAFCGLANPDSFRQTLERGFLIKGWQHFADHHPFTRADLAHLVESATRLGCIGLITTEKDFVKIKGVATGLPVWVLTVALRMEAGFDGFVLSRLGLADCRLCRTPNPAGKGSGMGVSFLPQ